MSRSLAAAVPPSRVAAALCTLAVAAAIALSAGVAPAHAANGCGPADWRGRFVPNAPFSFNFTAACNRHDACYGRAWWRTATTYADAKTTCDRRFYGDMSARCYTDYGDAAAIWSWCQYVAYGYYNAVARYGGGAFRNAQLHAR
jgi:hypothetical protein